MILTFINHTLQSNNKYNFLFSDEEGNKYHYSYETTIIDDTVIESVKQLLLDRLTPKLVNVKLSKIAEYSELSFTVRQGKLPDYKLINASLDIYDGTTKQQYKTFVSAFRTEFYRLKALVEACTTIEQVEAITHNFDSIVL